MDGRGVLVFASWLILCDTVSWDNIKAITSGVVFERYPDVQMSDHTWSVVVDYDLGNLQNEKEALSHKFRTVEKLLKPMLEGKTGTRSNYFKLTMAHLYQVFRDFEAEVTTLTDLLPKEHVQRVKRGWINFGGAALKTVFGTLDSSDLESINSKLASLETRGEEVLFSSKHQLAFMQEMEKSITNNTQFIYTMVHEFSEQLRKVQEVSNKNLGLMEGRMDEMSTFIDNEVMVRQISYALVDARMEVIALRQAFESSVAGQLSSILIPPEMFLSILGQIKGRIQEPLSMLALCDHEHLSSYYKIAQVQIMVIKTSLRLVINIPLSSRNGLLEQYRIHAFPVYTEEFKKHILWQVNEILLVSRDRHSFSVTTIAELGMCKKGPMWVCPSNLPIFRDNDENCELNLFKSRINSHKCGRLVLAMTHPVLKRVGGNWLFSLSEPTPVTFLCGVHEQRNEPVTLRLKGSGMMTDVSHCDISAPFFRLPSTGHEEIHINKSLPIGHVPLFTHVLEKGERLMLANITTSKELIQLVDDFFTEGRTHVKFDEVMQSIRVNEEKQKRNQSIGIGSGTVGLCIVLGVIGIMYYKRRQIRAKWNLKAGSSEPPSSVPATSVVVNITNSRTKGLPQDLDNGNSSGN